MVQGKQSPTVKPHWGGLALQLFPVKLQGSPVKNGVCSLGGDKSSLSLIAIIDNFGGHMFMYTGKNLNIKLVSNREKQNQLSK